MNRKTKIILHDQGVFSDWMARGCSPTFDEDTDEYCMTVVNTLWNSQCGIRRKLWHTSNVRAGSSISFDDPEMAVEVTRILERVL